MEVEINNADIPPPTSDAVVVVVDSDSTQPTSEISSSKSNYERLATLIATETRALVKLVDEMQLQSPTTLAIPQQKLEQTVKAFEQLQDLMPEYAAKLAPLLSELSQSDATKAKDILKRLVAVALDSFNNLAKTGDTDFSNDPSSKLAAVRILDELSNDCNSESSAASLSDLCLPELPKSERPSILVNSSPLPEGRRSSTLGDGLGNLMQRVSSMRGLPTKRDTPKPVSARISSTSRGRQSVSISPTNQEMSAFVTTELNQSQLISSCLFGDPNMPVATVANLTTKEHTRTFNARNSAAEKSVALYASITGAKMKLFSQQTRKKLFDLDLTKWESDR
ncbi:hypothetical protein HDU80_010185 [Chytriomyces hyalinus]|nr:hypothetical protein HDU80_010185 [Chytriomyces hyalinus]